MIKKKVVLILAGAVVLGSITGGAGKTVYAADFEKNKSLIEAGTSSELGSTAMDTLEADGWVKKDNVVTSPDKSMKLKSYGGVDGIDAELTITVMSEYEDILDVVRMMTGTESKYTAEELTQFIHNGTCIIDDGSRSMKVQYNGQISFECVITFFTYGYAPTAEQRRIQLEFDKPVVDEEKPDSGQPPVVEKPSEGEDKPDVEVPPVVEKPSEGEDEPDVEVPPVVEKPSEGEDKPDVEVPPVVEKPSEGEDKPDVEVPPVVEKPSEDEVPSEDNNKVVIEDILQGLDKENIILNDGDGSKENPYKIEFKVYDKEKIQSIIDMGEVVSREEVDGYTIINIRIPNKVRAIARINSENYTNIVLKFKNEVSEETITEKQEEIVADGQVKSESSVVKTSDGIVAVPLITAILSLAGTVMTRRKK